MRTLRMRLLVLAVFSLRVASLRRLYKVVKTWKLGGNGGWDTSLWTARGVGCLLLGQIESGGG